MYGYGPEPPEANWPNNKRLALSFVVNYEEGGENTPYNNDENSEVFLNETPGGTKRQERDLNMETIYEYGSVRHLCLSCSDADSGGFYGPFGSVI